MANIRGMYVKLDVDKVMRAGFRAAREREGFSAKQLAAAAGSGESFLLRFEKGQYIIRQEHLDGLINAHKLLKLDVPEVSEPFEYGGNGVLPGTKMRRKKKKQQQLAKPVATAVKVVQEAVTSSVGASGAKTVTELMLLVDLEKRGILTADAAKTAMHKLVHQLDSEL